MMGKLAAEQLPDGFGFAWTDIAFQQKLAGNTTLLIFTPVFHVVLRSVFARKRKVAMVVAGAVRPAE